MRIVCLSKTVRIRFKGYCHKMTRIDHTKISASSSHQKQPPQLRSLQKCFYWQNLRAVEHCCNIVTLSQELRGMAAKRKLGHLQGLPTGTTKIHRYPRGTASATRHRTKQIYKRGNFVSLFVLKQSEGKPDFSRTSQISRLKHGSPSSCYLIVPYHFKSSPRPCESCCTRNSAYVPFHRDFAGYWYSKAMLPKLCSV
jgi:hypothetical protein